jgi:hypothetical protein
MDYHVTVMLFCTVRAVHGRLDVELRPLSSLR